MEAKYQASLWSEQKTEQESPQSHSFLLVLVVMHPYFYLDWLLSSLIGQLFFRLHHALLL